MASLLYKVIGCLMSPAASLALATSEKVCHLSNLLQVTSVDDSDVIDDKACREAVYETIERFQVNG